MNVCSHRRGIKQPTQTYIDSTVPLFIKGLQPTPESVFVHAAPRPLVKYIVDIVSGEL